MGGGGGYLIGVIMSLLSKAFCAEVFSDRDRNGKISADGLIYLEMCDFKSYSHVCYL